MRPAASQWLLGLFLYAGCMQSPSASNSSLPALSAEKAMEHVRAQVALGPRPPGSETLAQCREYIVRHLKEYGYEIEEDKFEATTPYGPKKMCNVIARTGKGDKGVIALASPVLTFNWYRSKIRWSDGSFCPPVPCVASARSGTLSCGAVGSSLAITSVDV